MTVNTVTFRSRHIVFGMTALFLNLVATKVNALEQIQWARLDFPPFEINETSLKHRGIVDLVKLELQLALPQHQHQDAGVMNQSRLSYNFKNQNICHSGLIRTAEIESQAYLSLGIGLMPSHVIITTTNNLQQKFRGQEKLSLQQLIRDKSLQLGVPSRTMGPKIDPLIELYKGQSHVLLRKATEINGLFDMLLKQRIDYIIGYPAEAMFWNKLHPNENVITIPLAETEQQYVIGRVACSKNSWGLAMVREINDILRKRRLQDDYIYNIFMPWVQADAQQSYLKDFRQILQQDQWTNAQ